MRSLPSSLVLLCAALSHLATSQPTEAPSFSSKITFCSTDSNCTNKGLTNCLAGGCVDLKNLKTNEIAFQVSPPNNIYVVFSLWDGACHPVVWDAATLGPRLTIYENGYLQSVTESFNGLLPAPQAVSASIVLVLDMSPSVSNQTTTMRAAILSFISGISDRIGSVALKIAILGFDGRKEMIDMLNSTGRAGEPGKPALERQEQYFVLTKANQPKLAEYVGGMKMGPQIVGNDLSTNLHGAVTGGLSLLDKSTSLVNIMVLFTDGKDQAGVVSAEAAITKANASKVKGVLIFGIYLKSTEQSSDLINSVSTPSYSFNIDNINQLVTEFDRFATFIAMVCSNVYVYMYCSPKRAGTTKVQMFLNSAPASLEHAVDTADFDTTTKEGVCTKEMAQSMTLEKAKIKIKMSKSSCFGQVLPYVKDSEPPGTTSPPAAQVLPYVKDSEPPGTTSPPAAPVLSMAHDEHRCLEHVILLYTLSLGTAFVSAWSF